MRSLLERLSRRSHSSDPAEGFAEMVRWGDWVWPAGWRAAVAAGDPSLIDRSWNSVGTLAAGPMADVDRAGTVALRHWPISIDTWVRVGERWIHPSREPGVSQHRVEGLPVIETRLRTGSTEVVFTAGADEGGRATGRVLVGVENRSEIPIAVATVVRPFRALGRGRARSIRLVGQRVVVDGTPLIELPVATLDAATGSASSGDVHLTLSDALVGAESVTNEDGSATLAAIWPLAAGAEATVAVVDGRHPVDSPPATFEQIRAGWRTHLDGAADVSLPGWPDHIWASLLSGLLLRVEEPGPPLGANRSTRGDDATVAAALAAVGLFDAAEIELVRLLDGLTDGSIPRADWAVVGAVLARAGLGPVHKSWPRHGAAAAAALGALAEFPVDPSTRTLIARALERAAGPRAAADASRIDPVDGEADVATRLAELGVELADPLPARPADPLAVVRAAGTTWRWERDGAGDSPHARAAIAWKMRKAAVRETADGLDLGPGFAPDWLGRSADVARLPTAAGLLSYSIRWHGARPALLWELEPLDDEEPSAVTASAIDPGFRTVDTAGEALLAAPTGER